MTRQENIPPAVAEDRAADTVRRTTPAPLSLARTTTSDGVTVLRPHGEIDHCTVAPLRQALTDTPTTAPARTVVDLSEVTFMDSTGLNALIIGQRATRGTPGWIRLAHPRPCVQRVLRLSGLDAFIDCYPTLDQALAR
ncbi:STAS domain-containing protein [Streptomyces minutiscleroticus]|nr:STAS domain-containing protein [Streptomyces minutiscleroticus]